MTKISKYLSLLLRHRPDILGLNMDENGWVNVDELIFKMQSHGTNIDKVSLEKIVKNSDKQRFAFNEDKSNIRANQGHSIEIDLNLTIQIPPKILYHGTAKRFLESIFKLGLQRQTRQHVHLSLNIDTALKVGIRHGEPAILEVSALKMHEAGFSFFKSKNGVWLTKEVLIQYLKEISYYVE